MRSPRTGSNPCASRVWTEMPFLRVTLRANTITSLIAALRSKCSFRGGAFLICSRMRSMISPDRSASATTQESASLTSPRSGGCIFRKILGCPGVVARAGDRLRDLVRERGCQFSHHAHSVHVGEIRLHLLQSRQRLHAILDFRQENIPARDAPRVIAKRDE